MLLEHQTSDPMHIDFLQKIEIEIEIKAKNKK
jgi:hypothetical protein